jgi:ribonuclease P/MRP protein subunit POP8
LDWIELNSRLSTIITTAMTTTTTTTTTMPDVDPPKKRPKPNASATHHKATLRNPRWTYFHLSLFSSSVEPESLDELTARRYLTASLSRFLGLMGTAISIDLLKITGRDVYIRVPKEDAAAVHEAVSSWIGTPHSTKDGNGNGDDDGNSDGAVRWTVKGRNDWLVGLSAGTGQDLFSA